MKHAKLVSSMKQSANWRGHTMKQSDKHEIGHRVVSFWNCHKCGMGAMVDTQPPPNGMDISGDAIALSCEDKMTFERFEVHEAEGLQESEEQVVINQEALWFYHSYYRTELELLELAHGLLLATGKHNYKSTVEYRTVEDIIAQLNDNPEIDKVKIICGLTGNYDLVDIEYLPEIYTELIHKIGERLTNAHGIDGYSVCYHEGEWGLWPDSIHV